MIVMNDYYHQQQQTQLMLQLLPLVAQEKCFALKGGTAINFFVRNLPRYSVDIDLTYLYLKERNCALQEISDAMDNIAKNIERYFPNLKVSKKYAVGKKITKLFINYQNIQVSLPRPT